MSSFAKAIGTANLLCVGRGGWRRCGVLGGGEETVHLGEAQEMLHFLPSRCCWAWLRNLLALAPLCLVLLGNVMALSCSTCHITCDKYMHTRLSANYAKWVHTCVSYGVGHARGLYLMSCHVMSCHVISTLRCRDVEGTARYRDVEGTARYRDVEDKSGVKTRRHPAAVIGPPADQGRGHTCLHVPTSPLHTTHAARSQRAYPGTHITPRR